MKIAVIGTGYVGLVRGPAWPRAATTWSASTRSPPRSRGSRQGKVPIYEPGLAELVHRNLRDGRLTFTTDLAAGIAEAEIVFIAVGTPQGDARRRRPRAASGRSAAQIAENLHSPKIIVIKSTVPVGTNAELARRMAEVTDGPVRRRQQPRVPQGRGGDRRLQQARPRRRRRPPRRRSPSGCTSCMPRSCAPTGRSWS